MDAYCPKCQTSTREERGTVTEKGICHNCGGQLSIGSVAADSPVDGAVAMTFGAGSKAAVPLDASFEQATIDESPPGAGEPPLPPTDWELPPVPDVTADEQPAEMPAHVQAALGGAGPAGPTFADASMDAPDHLQAASGSALDAGPTMEAPAHLQAALNAEAAVGKIEDEAAAHTFPPTEVAPAPLADEPTAPDPTPAEPAGVGTHLQLPSIDFSVPDLGSAGASTPSTTAATPPSDLPAHLQLPSFPDFELPPIPGTEGERATGDLQIESAGGGSFGDAQTDVSPAPAGSALDAGDWTVGAPEQAAQPPPLPEPPPIPAKKQPESAATSDAGALPDLPAFGLPALDSKKSEPTLVQTNVAIQLAGEEPSKRSMASALMIGLLVVAALAVVGGVVTVAVVGVDKTMRAVGIGKEKQPTAEEIKRKKAEDAYWAGIEKYKAGEAAEKAKKKNEADKAFRAAEKSYKKALKHNPRHALAHKNLGIVLAKLKRPKEAVKHYKLYLKYMPNAADKKAVLEIINQWEMAQQKQKR